jgi:poly(A) polymerase
MESELAEWWEDFALGDEDERVALLQAVREQQGPRRVAAVRTPRPVPGPDGPTTPEAEAPDAAAPRKRRRRRRRPAGGDGGDAGGSGAGPASPANDAA